MTQREDEKARLIEKLIKIREASEKASKVLIEEYLDDWYSNYNDLHRHAVQCSITVASWPKHKQNIL